SPKQVETLTHQEAKRTNIPSAEHQSVMAEDERSPVEVAYPRGENGLDEEKANRNRDLDPQLVWRGKDEQDWSDLVVHAPPLYIQEKVHPKALIDDLLRQSRKHPSPPGRGAGGEGLIPRSVSEAEGWLEQAVAGLRAAGQQDDLPRGLLARAALFRHTHDFARARQDLQEVFDIAEPSGMRLFVTDYHLEMARVLVTEAGYDIGPHANPASQANRSGNARCVSEFEGYRATANAHIEVAADLIAVTGYHRRDAELAELTAILARAFG
ncbi:MAG: hypothetical protein ACFCUG_08470, partial [Thiotrichales bacterium]